MKSSDIFDLCNKTNNQYKKGMALAQSRYDNAEPENNEIEETAEEVIEAHKSYKFAMQMAINTLSSQLELYKKYGHSETCDLIENDIDEILHEVARREKKFIW